VDTWVIHREWLTIGCRRWPVNKHVAVLHYTSLTDCKDENPSKNMLILCFGKWETPKASHVQFAVNGLEHVKLLALKNLTTHTSWNVCFYLSLLYVTLVLLLNLMSSYCQYGQVSQHVIFGSHSTLALVAWQHKHHPLAFGLFKQKCYRSRWLCL